MRPLVERMVAARARLAEIEDEQLDVAHIVSGNGSGYAVGEARGEGFAEAAAELRAAVDELQAIGVIVKDADSGLVDFPAERDGEPVLLCWQLGEPSVEFWHDHAEGFAGRKPVDWGEQ